MFTVRTKAGRIVGRYATKAEAEACVRQGRTARSPGGRSVAKVSYQFPNYETHAFRSSEDAAREYRQLAEHHRRNARAYLKAAEERETRNGKSDKACATWRKRAVSELKIAQRAQNEALVLASQGSPTGHRSVIQAKAKRTYGGQWANRASGQHVFIHYVDPGNNHIYFQLVPWGGRGNMSLEEFHRLYRKLPAKERSPVRGAARQRLLRVHADVSRKLWAKSPLPRDMNERAEKLSAMLRKEPSKFTPGQAKTVYREVALLANELHNVVGDAGTNDSEWQYIEKDLEEAHSRFEGGSISASLNKTHAALQIIRGVLQRTTHGPRHGDGYYRSGMSKIAYPVQVLNVDQNGWVHVRGLGKRFRNRTFTIVRSEFTTYLPMGARAERV